MRKLIFISILALLLSCSKTHEELENVTPQLMQIPEGFPDVVFPEDNSFTYERWLLGKKLFYDPIMSVDESISCSSCHKQAFAFADESSFTDGVFNRKGKRNVPTLSNVAYQPYFTSEGGVPTLEMQILVPIQEHNEFDFNIVLLAERLKKDSTYKEMSLKSYGREPDHFVITRALACFERSLISGNSTYDRFIKGEAFLTTEEELGMSIFFGNQANCSSCHRGYNFSNYSFENNGLYLNYEDEGRKRLTGNTVDDALFKVPTLRNIELTAPYMHDGSISSLEDVIEHYASGGKDHPHKSQLIKGINLTIKEKQALIKFLQTLTDYTFIENPLFN